MSQPDLAEWKAMASAPRDGTRVLVAVRASEQGPAEVDVVRWAKPEPAGEECWVATDSEPGARIIYTDADLSRWMPLPTPLPRLRSVPATSDHAAPASPYDSEEMDGSAI